MNFLQERIIANGIIKPGNVLKVDSFLNHQMDIDLIEQIGAEFHRRFAGKPITKVMTIESSGIAIAYPVARAFGVPLLCAKKHSAINIDGPVLMAEIESSIGKRIDQVMISQKMLSKQDHVSISSPRRTSMELCCSLKICGFLPPGICSPFLQASISLLI